MTNLSYEGTPVVKRISAAQAKAHLSKHGRATSARPRGALAVAGAWQEVDDRDLDALVADVYSARAKDTGRPQERPPFREGPRVASGELA